MQDLVPKAEECPAAQLVHSGVCTDVDPPEANVAACGIEGILSYAHLANGFLRRHTAAGEAVDEDLCPIRSGGWSGHRLGRRSQCVEVVGQHVEILAT